MDNLVSFPGKVAPCEILVKSLEELLERAKTGEIQGITYITTDFLGGGDWGWAYAEDSASYNEVIGDLQTLVTKLCVLNYEQNLD